MCPIERHWRDELRLALSNRHKAMGEAGRIFWRQYIRRCLVCIRAARWLENQKGTIHVPGADAYSYIPGGVPYSCPRPGVLRAL